MAARILYAVSAILLAASAAYLVSLAFGGDGACAKPVTLLESEVQNALTATDAYLAAGVAAKFRDPESLGWFVLQSNPKPAKITATIAVGDGYDGFGSFAGDVRVFSIVLSRDCAGDDWTVDSLKLDKGQPALPLAGAGAAPAKAQQPR